MSPFSPPNIELRSRAAWYLEKFILTPYIWAGDDFSGVDCSGLIVEIEKMLGWLLDNEDLSANGFWERYKQFEVSEPYMGCYIFWFKNERAIHIGMMMDNELLVHSSGGGSSTKTIDDAIRSNAFVKPRNFKKYAHFRKEAYNQEWRAVDPFKLEVR